MSNETKSVSEREATLRERAAFIAGKMEGRCDCKLCVDGEESARKEFEAKARALYPLKPKIVPRVATDKYGNQWRVTDDGIEGLLANRRPREWRADTPGCLAFTDAQFRLAFAKMLMEPTEEIEDVG